MCRGHVVVSLRLEQRGFSLSSPSTAGSHPWGSVWWKLLFFGVTCIQLLTSAATYCPHCPMTLTTQIQATSCGCIKVDGNFKVWYIRTQSDKKASEPLHRLLQFPLSHQPPCVVPSGAQGHYNTPNRQCSMGGREGSFSLTLAY